MSRTAFVFICLAVAIFALVANPPKPPSANDRPAVVSY
jgi:hypothetical protein